jgi:hypothetical protein
MGESFWDFFSEHFKEEWAVISGSPHLVAVIALAVGFITWLACNLYYKGRIETLKAHLEFHKDRAHHGEHAEPEDLRKEAQKPEEVAMPITSKDSIEIRYGTSPSKLITVTVTNHGDREERVQGLVIHLRYANGKVDTVTAETKDKLAGINSLKRADKIPHVMPPRSSFEAELVLSEGTFIAYQIAEFQVTVKMEDGTIIEGEKKITKRP